ncbi:MAG: dTDP-4-dehydrorhamnose 3,5-epimerase [Chloroflexota bacterium]|nr:dTDP-4-dehydrorhamnose 3,5-epimerase [Chloroflexota bacterium]
MKFGETKLSGAFIVDIEPRSDERGFFTRAFCANEFAERGLKTTIAQANISFNHTRGTLRGMHMQVAPAPETKFIRVMRGAIYDVIIDMRPESPTFMQHIGVELTADNHRALYIPEMFAHGFQTLEDNTEVIYLVGEFYTPGTERGYRYDDPAFKIDWPLPVSIVSSKDAQWPLVEAVR